MLKKVSQKMGPASYLTEFSFEVFPEFQIYEFPQIPSFFKRMKTVDLYTVI